MDRDYFIILVYCLVCDHYALIATQFPIRRGGCAPALTDEAVIPIERCGEYFKLHPDLASFASFRAQYQPWFPRLRDRTRFVRQAAN